MAVAMVHAYPVATLLGATKELMVKVSRKPVELGLELVAMKVK